MKNQFTNQSFNFQYNWSVRQRPIYRLLDKIEYIDNFFETGEIQLSCFNIFKKYKNEIQGDKDEGKAMLFVDAPEGKQVGMYYQSGINSYVLSTTKEPTSENIKDFNAVGAIKILNPVSFAIEIARKLPYFVGGVEGECKYVEERILSKKMDEKDSSSFNIEKFTNIQNQFELLNKYSQNDETFLKLMKYKPQDEYRLVWYVNNNIDKHLIIKSPEASDFCDKVIF